MESIKDEREKSSLKSIFVSGLKKDFFIKNIEEHFLKYGKIIKIIIDKEKVNRGLFKSINYLIIMNILESICNN